MYHTSEHYSAIVDNGAVALARNMDELLAETMDALEHPERRRAAMRKTLEQKAAYCDGTSARHFVEALAETAEAGGLALSAVERPEVASTGEVVAIPVLQHQAAAASPLRKAPQHKKAMGY